MTLACEGSATQALDATSCGSFDFARRLASLRMTLHSRDRGRPGPGLAGVAKREDSYGPKSGPNAGSRASSPGEQAAACDYRKRLVSWAGEQAAACDYKKTRELGYARD